MEETGLNLLKIKEVKKHFTGILNDARGLFTIICFLASGGVFADEDIAHFNDMVVTAQRRSENIQTIPLSVDAISSLQLENRHISTANDLDQEIPGLQITNPHGDVQPIFSLRGISASDYTSNQSSPIGVYLDETYLGSSTTHGLSFFDLERVEVLKGPQGTLYGRNTTGGTINLITRTPNLNAAPEAIFRFGYGSFQQREVFGAGETTLIPDRLAVRAAIDYKKNDGWFNNKTGPDMAQTDRAAGRLTVNGKLSERIDALFKLTIARSDGRSTPPRGVGAVSIPGLGMANFNGYVRPSSLGFHEGEINYIKQTKVDFDHAALRLSYNADSMKFISVSSWYDTEFINGQDSDGSPLSLLEIDWGYKGKAFAEDLRIESNWDGPFSLIGGIYASYEESTLHNITRVFKDSPVIVAATNPQSAHLLSQFGIIDHKMTTETLSTSVYSQGRYQFTEQLGVDIGVRYTADQNRLKYINVSHLDHAGNPLGSWVPGNNSGIDAPFLPPDFGGIFLDAAYTNGSAPSHNELNQNVSGKFSVDYAFSDNFLAYTSYNRGYRNGNYNPGVFYSASSITETGYTQPETVNAYELGFKSDWFDHRLLFNLAGYYYDYANQQVINVIGISSQLINAGGAEIYGLESSLIMRPLEGLRLSLGTNLMHSEYQKLSLANTQTTDIANDMLDLSGNRMIAAPDFQLTAALDYSFQPFWGGLIDTGISVNYQSKQWFSAYNGMAGYQDIKQDAYSLMKAYIAISDPSDQVTLSFHIDNVLDQNYNAYAINLDNGFGYNFFQSGPPRNLSADLTVKF